MKILQIIGSLHIGGAEQVALNIAKYINSSEFEIHYLVFGDKVGEYEKEAIKKGAKIHRIALPNNNYFIYVRDLYNLMKSERFDVVHSHMLLNNGLNLMIAKMAGVKKRISHSHSTNPGRSDSILLRIYEKSMKTLIKSTATELIACGQEAGEYLYGKKKFDAKGLILKNGIDTQKFEFNSFVRQEIINELGIVNKLIIGHVGRFVEVKNHIFLLDIFAEIKKEIPNSVLILVGHGEKRHKIECKIEELNLQKDVILTGARTDVHKIMQIFDVLVFPSLYEGYPLTLLEAQAAGICCVVSENITKAVKLTELINFLSLKESPSFWAKKVKEISNYKKKSHSQTIKNNGFDAQTNIRTLEMIYLN